MMTSNIHTHTCMTDGADSAREMVLGALERGFTGLGFSEHWDPGNPCLLDEALYREEICRLKEEFSGRIDILCGIELDAFAPQPAFSYDYVIGSVHNIEAPDHSLFAVDHTPGIFLEGAKRYFGSDMMRCVRAYYETVAEAVRKTRPEVVGHFDLVAKFNRGNALFDEESPQYIRLAMEALDEAVRVVQPAGGLFEINCGAMARGYRDFPYPAPFLVRRLREKNARVIITSDAHAAAHLGYGYEAALALVRACGYSEMTVMRDGVFTETPVDG